MLLFAVLILSVCLGQQLLLFFGLIQLPHMSQAGMKISRTYQIDAANNQFALHVGHLLSESLALLLGLA